MVPGFFSPESTKVALDFNICSFFKHLELPHVTADGSLGIMQVGAQGLQLLELRGPRDAFVRTSGF